MTEDALHEFIENMDIEIHTHEKIYLKTENRQALLDEAMTLIRAMEDMLGQAEFMDDKITIWELQSRYNGAYRDMWEWLDDARDLLEKFDNHAISDFAMKIKLDK